MDRRRLITLGGLAVGGTAAVSACRGVYAQVGADPADAHHHGHGEAGGGSGTTVEPFSVPLPVPPVLSPAVVLDDADLYQVSIRSTRAELLPGVSTPVLGYNGQFLGPTIRARRGRRVAVRFVNRLAHPANVHLHGGQVAATSDGHPMDVIEPGAARVYEYPNQQRGATLWYHDHSHHTEAEHVYRGLHGFYLIDDDAERDLALPSGAYDIPVLLRDALFAADGSLVFNPADALNRPTILANGRPQPYLRVATRRYRLRLLNASAHRIFQLRFDGAPAVQIGTDGGLLPAPVPVTTLTLSPGERADVVVDFAGLLGGAAFLTDPSGPVLRFDVVKESVDRSRVPARLRALPPMPPATVTRDVTLSFDPERVRFMLDGRVFDATRVDAVIREGSTEIWRITNADTALGIDHNFHLHLTQFRILDRDGVPPSPAEAGWKDTVLIRPGSSVRVQATFAGHRGRYVYHCHLLEHSQLGMMAQFQVV